MSYAALTTLFEHEYTSGFNWSDRELASLDRINRSIGDEILLPAMRGGARELKAGSLVGVVRLGNRTVQVLPKIYRSTDVANEQECALEATRNLVYLLAYAGQLPIREHDLAPMLRHGSDWFEILTRLFATHMLEEWQRGAHRTYVTIEDDSPVLKGKWRISEQLRHPMRQHIFSVAYDEFTADNPLNRIFHFVTERLWRLTRNNSNRQTLGELRQWMEEVSLPAHVNVADANPSMLTRLNQRYAPLLNLARLFLDGGTLRLTAGDFSTFAFTFDMNQLFEAFIINFIRRHREVILPPALQACDLLPQSRGSMKYLAYRNLKPVFLLKPDLAFRNQAAQFPMLLDTKYKRLVHADAKLGVSQADLYQMHSYAHRFDSDSIVLLYPQTADSPHPLRIRFRVEDSNISIYAATVDLRIALETQEGRDKLIKELTKLLQEEIFNAG